MAYVPVPNDLSRIKTKLAFNLTKRQLICFSIHKALKTQMTAIRAELERIAAGGSVPDELLSTIDLIAVTMQGLKGEDANE